MSGRSYRQLMADRGFLALLVTQFLGACNDNLFRFGITYFAIAAANRSPEGFSAQAYIALIGILFILPFLLFSGAAGAWADRAAKSRVLVIAKGLEIPAMAIGLLAFAMANLPLMLAALFAMAWQSTLFSPAKYAILPEILPDRDLTRGNALIELSTFLAILIGTILGGAIFEWQRDDLAILGATALALAGIGFLTSFAIAPTAPPSAPPSAAISLLPLAGIGRALRDLYAESPLWLTALGISWFWFMGALAQATIPLYGTRDLGLGEAATGWLQAMIGIGIGLGSLLAGRWAKGGLGEALIAPSLAGIGLTAMVLWAVADFAPALMVCLALGAFGGLYAVPLNALLQRAAPSLARGRRIAANNVLNMLAVLAANLVALVGGGLGLPPAAILALGGGASLLLVRSFRQNKIG